MFIDVKSKSALILFITLLPSVSVLSSQVQADELGSVSVKGDIKPANPSKQQVWYAHWSEAYQKCRNQFGDNSKSVALAEYEPTAGGRNKDRWNINSVWICKSN